MTFDTLSNEEIAFIYLILEDQLDGFNEVAEDGGVTYIVDSPVGEITIFKEFTPEYLKKIREGIKVKLLTSIIDKFSPVYDLINEENTAAVDAVRQALFPTEETDEDKDM